MQNQDDSSALRVETQGDPCLAWGLDPDTSRRIQMRCLRAGRAVGRVRKLSRLRLRHLPNEILTIFLADALASVGSAADQMELALLELRRVQRDVIRSAMFESEGIDL